MLLQAAALVGMVVAFEAGLRLGNPVMIDSAVTLGLAAAILIGVARAQAARMKPLKQAPLQEPIVAPTPGHSRKYRPPQNPLRPRENSCQSDSHPARFSR